MIEWTQEYSVGVDELDEQHKQLFKMVNKLMENPAATVDSETISYLLSDMREYAAMHFKTEEEYMFRCEYPDLEHHKNQHREFRRTMLDLCSRTMANDRQVPTRMTDYLVEWLVRHVLHSDKKYAPFLSAFASGHSVK